MCVLGWFLPAAACLQMSDELSEGVLCEQRSLAVSVRNGESFHHELPLSSHLPAESRAENAGTETLGKAGRAKRTRVRTQKSNP